MTMRSEMTRLRPIRIDEVEIVHLVNRSLPPLELHLAPLPALGEEADPEVLSEALTVLAKKAA